jgi:two-component system sensor histidine kinase/response regulator
MLTLTTGAMALVRYYTKKSSAYLLLGSGFLGTSILNGYHGAITSTFLAGRTPSALAALTTWSGAVPQVFLSLILCASLVAGTREKRRPTANAIKEGYVYCFVGLLTLATFLFFAFVPLGPAYYPDRIIHHPTDAIQTVFFGVAVIGYLLKGAWKDDDFEHWLLASLIVGTALHLVYLSFFHRTFDASFMAAHVMMLAQYTFVLVGLFISMHSIFKREAQTAADLSQANQALATEVHARQRVAEDLRQAHDELEVRVQSRTEELFRANEELADEIAGRKLVEEDLRQSGELVTLLLRSIPEGIYGVDVDGKCTFSNEACLRLLGYEEAAELLGKNMHDLNHHSRADGTPYAIEDCPIYSVFRSGKGCHVEDEVFWRKDKTSFPAEYWSSPIHRGEKTIGTVIMFLDATERKLAEHTLRVAKEAAESASLAKSEFLANMSHEIRTPMNGIIGMTELALDTVLTQEQREYLDIVRSSADSLLLLLNDILDFSKIEAGKLEMESIAFSLRDVLDETIKSISLRAHQKGLELVCHTLPDVPDALLGDPTRLRQIVLNLVGNAIKFTSQGEVALLVEKRQEAHNGVLLHFAVSDTGVGIPKEKQPSIFEAFTQADTSTTRKFGGTGLGLAICFQIVEIIGGRIWVESELGKGSTFHFDLRFALQDNPSVHHEPIGTEILRNLPVLVIDDNATNRRVLETALMGWGMKPTLAEGGRQALALMKQRGGKEHPFVLMLLDAKMPGMDGFRVAKAIKQDPNYPEPTIIMLTSSGARGDAKRCRELGIKAYLPKPIVPSDLLEAIKMALGSQQRSEMSTPVITRHLLRESRRKLKILLAEDNAVNQLLAVRLLEKRGHTVTVVQTGKLAVEALLAQAFDLVLMDIQMPEMDGLEATASIRQREKITDKHIPIVAMTAHAMVGDRELCLKAGMDAYVTKPLDVEKLFATIDDLLRSPVESSTV